MPSDRRQLFGAKNAGSYSIRMEGRLACEISTDLCSRGREAMIGYRCCCRAPFVSRRGTHPTRGKAEQTTVRRNRNVSKKERDLRQLA